MADDETITQDFVDKQLRSPTARAIVMRLHPGIRGEWLGKLMKVESEAVAVAIDGISDLYAESDPR